jgi:hypothetical protein
MVIRIGLRANKDADSLTSRCLSTYADVIAEAVEQTLDMNIRKSAVLVTEVASTKYSKGSEIKAINAEAVPVNERGSDFVSICFSDRVEKVLSTVALRAKKYAFIV